MERNFKKEHIEQLIALGFCGDYTSLRRIETLAHNLAEDSCNGYIDDEKYDEISERLTKKISTFFKDDKLPEGFFINGDPRGYALKIRDNIVREKNIKIATDWGGYGILCPDFN